MRTQVPGGREIGVVAAPLQKDASAVSPLIHQHRGFVGGPALERKIGFHEVVLVVLGRRTTDGDPEFDVRLAGRRDRRNPAASARTPQPDTLRARHVPGTQRRNRIQDLLRAALERLVLVEFPFAPALTGLVPEDTGDTQFGESSAQVDVAVLPANVGYAGTMHEHDQRARFSA